jgi:hypothetical protein
MRDSTKVIIGFGLIWGLFAFAGMLFSSFTIGSNDSAPEVLTILLYGLTILPSCILANSFMGPSGELLDLSGWDRRGIDSGRCSGSDRELLFRRQDDPANRFPEKSGFQ